LFDHCQIRLPHPAALRQYLVLWVDQDQLKDSRFSIQCAPQYLSYVTTRRQRVAGRQHIFLDDTQKFVDGVRC